MRRAAVAVLALALSVAAAPLASAGSDRDRATGGGQVFLADEPVQGAGDTIGFTAQSRSPEGNAATGQVQYIERAGGTGVGQVKFHGTVTCLEVEGGDDEGVAFISGVLKQPAEGGEEFFNLYVEDNGEPNQGNDVIVFQPVDEDADCDFDPSDDFTLARGNAQIYNAP